MPLTDEEYHARILAEGEWREADNPNTGGKYYYHKKTRESVKSLKAVIDKMRREDEAAEKKAAQQAQLKALQERNNASDAKSAAAVESAPTMNASSFLAAANKFGGGNDGISSAPPASSSGSVVSSFGRRNNGTANSANGNVKGTNANAASGKLPSAPSSQSRALPEGGPIDMPLPRPFYLPDKEALAAAALAGSDPYTVGRRKGAPEGEAEDGHPSDKVAAAGPPRVRSGTAAPVADAGADATQHEAGGGQCGDSPPPPPPQWVQTTAHNGDVFYVNTVTRETTGDLGLYLQIQHMLKATDMVGRDAAVAVPPIVVDTKAGLAGALGGGIAGDGSDDAATSARPATESSAVSAVPTVHRDPAAAAPPTTPPPLAVDLRDWVDVALSNPSTQQKAAERIIDTLALHRGGPPQEVLQRELTEVKAALQQSRDELSSARLTIHNQSKAIEDLQKALFYGIGAVPNYTLHSGGSTANSATSAVTAPHSAAAASYNSPGTSYTAMAAKAHHNAQPRPTPTPVTDYLAARGSDGGGAYRGTLPASIHRVLGQLPSNINSSSDVGGMNTRPTHAFANYSSSSSSSSALMVPNTAVYDATGLTLTTSRTSVGAPTTPQQAPLHLALEDARVHIDALEHVVMALQQHNRTLKDALNDANVGRHIENDCGVCEVLDPWKRLMVKTVGRDTFVRTRVDLSERSVPDTQSLYTQRPYEGLPEKSQYHHPQHYSAATVVASATAPAAQLARLAAASEGSRAGVAGDGHHEGRAVAVPLAQHQHSIGSSSVGGIGGGYAPMTRSFRSQLATGTAGAVVPHHNDLLLLSRGGVGSGPTPIAAASAIAVNHHHNHQQNAQSSPYRGVGGAATAGLRFTPSAGAGGGVGAAGMGIGYPATALALGLGASSGSLRY